MPTVFYAQEKFTLSGFVSDKNNGENIIGVNIFCKELKQGVVSNTYGFYSLTPVSYTHLTLPTKA